MSGFTPVKIDYVVTEPIDGEDSSLPPIIFLHGLTGAKEHWDHISSKISNATKRKAYALDARNHGDSEWSDDFNFDINVDDLFHFMDTHNIPKAVIIGHSMGGITGIRAALRDPGRVEKLIVEDMFTKSIPEPFLEMMAAQFDQLQQAVKTVSKDLDEEGAQRALFESSLQNMLKEMKIAKKPDARDLHEGIIIKRNPDGSYAYKANMTAIARAMRENNTLMSELEGSYDGPACFIYGEISHFAVYQEENHISQFFPNAEFVCIKGATHGVHFDSPTEFTDAVLQFVLKK